MCVSIRASLSANIPLIYVVRGYDIRAILSNATMSDNKLVKTVIEAATLTGLAAGIGWAAKKVVKENFTSDPSSSAMNYVKFSVIMTGSIALRQYLQDQKIIPKKERERHDRALEAYQAAYAKYMHDRTKLLDWIATNEKMKEQAKQKFTNTDYAFKLYNQAYPDDGDQ